MIRRPDLAPLLFVLAVVWGVSCWGVPAHDPDLGWHLLGGSWILDHGGVPRADMVNAFRRGWHDYHWLAQIGLASLYRLGGYELLRVALGGLTVVVFVGLWWLARVAKRGSLGAYSALVVVSAWFLVQEIVTVRPQMVAFLLLVLASVVVVRRRRWRLELAVLFPLTCVAVNVHVYWVLIPYLWFLYRVFPRIVRRRAVGALYGWGGLLLLTGAGLVSPYGIFSSERNLGAVLSNYAVVWDYLHMPEILKGSINELRSTLAGTSGVQVVVLVYLMIIARTARWKRSCADCGATAAAITGVAMTVLGIKFVAVGAILCLPYLVRHPLPVAVGRTRFVPLVGAGLCGLSGFFAYRAATTYPPRFPNTSEVDRFAPYTACRHLAGVEVPRLPGREEIRIATHFNHGGWCRWALYEASPQINYRVTTDNRTQGVPGEHYARSFDLFGAKGGWLETLAEWNPDAVVVQKAYPLAQFMGLSPDRWRKVFEDQEFAVFLPVASVRGPALSD